MSARPQDNLSNLCTMVESDMGWPGRLSESAKWTVTLTAALTAMYTRDWHVCWTIGGACGAAASAKVELLPAFFACPRSASAFA